MRKREPETDFLSAALLPNCSTVAEAERAKAGSQTLQGCLPCAWQAHAQLGHVFLCDVHWQQTELKMEQPGLALVLIGNPGIVDNSPVYCSSGCYGEVVVVNKALTIFIELHCHLKRKCTLLNIRELIIVLGGFI